MNKDGWVDNEGLAESTSTKTCRDSVSLGIDGPGISHRGKLQRSYYTAKQQKSKKGIMDKAAKRTDNEGVSGHNEPGPPSLTSCYKMKRRCKEAKEAWGTTSRRTPKKYERVKGCI